METFPETLSFLMTPSSPARPPARPPRAGPARARVSSSSSRSAVTSRASLHPNARLRASRRTPSARRASAPPPSAPRRDRARGGEPLNEGSRCAVRTHRTKTRRVEAFGRRSFEAFEASASVGKHRAFRFRTYDRTRRPPSRSRSRQRRVRAPPSRPVFGPPRRSSRSSRFSIARGGTSLRHLHRPSSPPGREARATSTAARR